MAKDIEALLEEWRKRNAATELAFEKAKRIMNRPIPGVIDSVPPTSENNEQPPPSLHPKVT